MSEGDRFWAKVDTSGGEDACWPWLAALDNHGYGIFWVAGRGSMESAHRVAFRLAGGSLAAKPPGVFGSVGEVVRHTRDRRECVNPRHLLRGTQADNMRDAIERGRLSPQTGVSNGNALLTDAQVRSIRSGYTGRHGDKSRIAREYGISTGYVSKLLAGQFRQSA